MHRIYIQIDILDPRLCSCSLDLCSCQILQVQNGDDIGSASLPSPQANSVQYDTACSSCKKIETASTTPSGLKPAEVITGEGLVINASEEDQNSSLTSTSTGVHQRRYVVCVKLPCHVVSVIHVFFLWTVLILVMIALGVQRTQLTQTR